MRNRYRRPKWAFTLIELLVVIAIIAILAAIVVPNLSRGRENSKIAFCAMNLKSIGAALTMYADDHKSFLPPVATEAAGGVIWDAQILPYLSDSKDVFVCPSDPYVDRSDPRPRRTYSCNGGFAHVAGRENDLPFGSYGSNTTHRLNWLKTRTGRLILVGERPGEADGNRGYLGEFPFCGMDQAPATIHRDGRGGNYLMADMAVQFMEVAQVVITDSNDMWYVETQ